MGGVEVKEGELLMNKCEERFWDWYSRQYSKLPEGEQFPITDEELLKLWRAMWPVAYSVGRARGHTQGYMHGSCSGGPNLEPMPYWKMEELFVGCETGREFGLRIEKWYGIRRD